MQPNDLTFDSSFFRTALGRFATGVTVITTEFNAPGAIRQPVGLTVNSFSAVSLSPALVLWSLSSTASTYDAFMTEESYVIQVLAANQTDIALRFARGTQSERFADMPLTRAPGGSLMLDTHSASWFECTPHSRHVAGDHTIMVGHVRHCGHANVPPLVFHEGGFDLTPLPEVPGRVPT